MPIKRKLANTKDMKFVKARKKPKTSEQKIKNKKALIYAHKNKAKIKLARKKTELHKTSTEKAFEKKHSVEIAKHSGKLPHKAKVVQTVKKVVTTVKTPEQRKIERLHMRDAKLSERKTQKGLAKKKVNKFQAKHKSRFDLLKKRLGKIKTSIQKKVNSNINKRINKVKKAKKQFTNKVHRKINNVKKSAKKIIKNIKKNTPKFNR